MGDVFEIMTYLIIILISSVVMVAWLKRKGKKKKARLKAGE
ncbi:hypothetical protein SAMN05216378_4543 [Paenibacillus catalpae]|uniref:Uncharacterized protein n=1 Tax=Paenibacillus catalpae TaxID=1045775 RepID=A0A1I2EXL7_9BACL|nr:MULTISPECIES: hypothetical protein [Paenibacillus]SFE97041.1 hypothetical protein SAMN05216378_4543 [Paenibacillus catalpae]